ncbi:MAG: pyridoxamine 5'-phosphate oxidase family protein [Burkholderiales bacterium]
MITNTKELRELYAAATGRALAKQLGQLDVHCRRFVGLSPFVVIASDGGALQLDASPRGGEPGFVKVHDDKTLLIPDAQGNNLLDTLTNILATGKVGLLFLVPGVDETLRINGTARLRDEDAYLQIFAADKRPPKLVIEVAVTEAFLHCGKSMMRSKLWAGDARVERSALPSMGQMLKDQLGLTGPAETQDEMVAKYAKDL